jgi:hypothetical protein
MHHSAPTPREVYLHRHASFLPWQLPWPLPSMTCTLIFHGYLQGSAERLHAQYPRREKEGIVKPLWVSHELKMGKLVAVTAPWKVSTDAEQTAFCQVLYDRCALPSAANWSDVSVRSIDILDMCSV